MTDYEKAIAILSDDEEQYDKVIDLIGVVI